MNEKQHTYSNTKPLQLKKLQQDNWIFRTKYLLVIDVILIVLYSAYHNYYTPTISQYDNHCDM